MHKQLTLLLILLLQLNVSTKLGATPSSSEELEAFLDGVWHSQKESHALMGAVVTVVKDGTVILNKGYGYADFESRRKVDPNDTLFRIASISKPFTWIAVMQLVEQGKLDLDQDVNTYLRQFQIPDTFAAPITMRHLMSHNAGFEDSVLDLGRRSADKLQPLGQYLADHLPRRVRPVGVFSSYSNHSTALAAHIIEEISGLDWSSYIEQNLLTPLAMFNTSARHPMAAPLKTKLATSYQRKQGRWKEQEYLYWFIYPAGMMSTTGGDMARFMINHLTNGTSVLQNNTQQQMLQPIFKPFEDANAWLHGYYQMNRNQTSIYGHGGDLNGFHSNLAFFPEHKLGLFVSFNSDPAAAARSHLVQAFIDHYFPQPTAQHPAPVKGTSYKELHGSYASLRRSFTDFAKLALLINHVNVSSTEDGYLQLSSPGSTLLFVANGEDQFVANEGYNKIKFERDEQGDVSHLHFSRYAASTMDKLEGLDHPTLHRWLLIIIALISCGYLLYWPVRSLRRRYYSVTNSSLPSWFYIISWSLAAAILVSLIRLGLALQDTEQFYFEIPQHIENSLLLILLASLALIPYFLVSIRFVWQGVGSKWERSNIVLLNLAGVLFVFENYYWNTLTYYLS